MYRRFRAARRFNLEQLLRRSAPKPAAEFRARLERDLGRTGSIGLRTRAGVAVGATVALVTPLLAFGGAGYAAAGARDALRAVSTVVTQTHQAHAVGSVSAAADQYGLVTLCSSGNSISVSQSAVAANLALGDTFGSCPVFTPPIIVSTGTPTLTLTLSKNYVVVVTTGNHKIKLGNGKNKLTVGNGKNTIVVGNGDNKIDVGTGNNVIHVGTGENNIHTGDGDNTIYVRNGKSDYVTCAPGNHDVVYADPASIDYVSAQCAVVHRAKYTG